MFNPRISGPDQRTSTADADQSPTTGLQKSQVHATNARWLHDVVMTNHHATDDRWLMVFDAASLPANGTVPTLPAMKVPAGSTGFYYGSAALPFTTGVVAACSTSAATLTITTTDEAAFAVTSRKRY